jgi:hypothetical protein
VSELQELVDSLAARLGRAVAIDDHQFHLAVFSSHAQDVDEVRLASILRREAPDEVQRWLLDLGIDQATRPVHVPANETLGMRARWCVPIRFEGLLLGYLWLVEEPTGPDDEEIGLAERCAAELAPLLYRERMLDDAGRLRERALVDRLLHSDADDRRVAADEAEAAGLLRLADSYAALLLERVATAAHGVSPPPAAEAGVLSGLERARRSLAPHSCLIGADGSRGIMIVALARGDASMASIEGALAPTMSTGAGGWVAVRGPCVDRLADIRTSFLGAADVIAVAAMLPPQVRTPVLDWAGLGAWRTLARVPRDATTEAAIHPALAVLAARSDGEQLLESLETFLEHAGDTTGAAERLHVHRTSLHARLRRIERDAGVDLGDGSQRLELHMGLRLMRLLGTWPLRPM